MIGLIGLDLQSYRAQSFKGWPYQGGTVVLRIPFNRGIWEKLHQQESLT